MAYWETAAHSDCWRFRMFSMRFSRMDVSPLNSSSSVLTRARVVAAVMVCCLGGDLDWDGLVFGIAECLDDLFFAFFMRFVRWIFLMFSGIKSSNPGGKVGPDEINDVGDDYFCLRRGANLLDIAMGGLGSVSSVG